MQYKTFEDLIAGMGRTAGKRTVAVVAAQDGHTLEAVAHAANTGIINALLIGDEAAIQEKIAKLQESFHAYTIIPVKDNHAAALEAAKRIRSGEAHFLMKGAIATPDLMKALFTEEAAFRVGSLISHLNFVQIPNYHKLIAITDVALLIAPTLEQKKGLIENAVSTFARMAFDTPKVAVLAASETVNPKMPETEDAAALTRMNRTGEITGCIVEGPLSYDLAIDKEAAEIKKLTSPVCGDADILVVPSIASGNMLVKALRYSALSRTAAIVVGGRAPLVLPSRATDADNKFLPIAVAAAASVM